MDINLLGSVAGGAENTSTESGQQASFNPSAEPLSTWTAPEWAKGLNIGEEILKEPMFSSVKDMNDVVKGYYHAQKMVGADRVVIPNKNSTAEQWKDYYVKAGLPAGLEDYKAELPPSMDNKEFNKLLTAKAYEMNIRPDQLSSIANEMEKYNEQIVTGYEQEQAQEKEQTSEGLKKEWGNDFQRNLMGIQKTIEHFGGKDLLRSVLESPLSNDGHFLRLLNNITSKLNREDTFSQDVVQTFGMSSKDAQSKINDIYADNTGAYYDSNSPKHKSAVEEMLRYQEIISRQS
jgi:hypothetical protein